MLVSFVAVFLFFRTRMGSPCAPSPTTRKRRWPRASRSAGVRHRLGRAAALAVLGAICADVADRPGHRHGGTSALAFRALPAVILGGLDSVVGALVGGFVIGLAEVFAGTYLAEYTDTLGTATS